MLVYRASCAWFMSHENATFCRIPALYIPNL
nr:MAG TPA: hypothetical protein [Caudoviricetes sp.]